MAGWTEDERLSALAQHAVLDTPPELVFNELVEAAAQACGAPMAAVSLVDRDRQWFKARVGLTPAETPRDISFCAHTIAGDGTMVVPDAALDPRFMDNALVTGEPGLRFYAGAMIRSAEGLPLGALCVLDVQARPAGLSKDQIYVLQVLADQASEQLRLRRLVQRQRTLTDHQADAIRAGIGREDRLLRALHSGDVGWWEWDVEADVMIGSAELARGFGVDVEAAAAGAPLETFLAKVHRNDMSMLREAIHEAVRTGDPFREEFRLPGDGDEVRWVSARGMRLNDPDGPSYFSGVVIDISGRKRTEGRLRDVDQARELAMNAAHLGSWDYDMTSGVCAYDSRALELLGMSARQAHDDPELFPGIHIDDRAQVLAAVQAATDPERTGPFRQTFRVGDAARGDLRWLSAYGRTYFRDGVCIRFVGAVIDITEERQAQDHLRLLSHELNHRVKNTLAVTSSIVDATLRNAGDLLSARRDVAARLTSYSRAHDLLTAQSWSSAAVSALVEGLIDSLSLPRERVELSGPALRLGPKPALHLSLALHELATNAVKYGAFANDTGRVAIAWSADVEAGERLFRFTWTERGGPPVAPPTRQGFGSRLIRTAIAAEFEGESRIDYPPTGVCWSLIAPYDGLTEKGRSPLVQVD